MKKATGVLVLTSVVPRFQAVPAALRTQFHNHDVETELVPCLPTLNGQVVKLNVCKGLCIL